MKNLWKKCMVSCMLFVFIFKMPVYADVAEQDMEHSQHKAVYINRLLLLGDADLSGEVDLTDVQLILRDYLEMECLADEKQKFVADYDGDGDIDLVDVQETLWVFLEVHSEFDCQYIDNDTITKRTGKTRAGSALLKKSITQKAVESVVFIYSEQELADYMNALADEEERALVGEYQSYFDAAWKYVAEEMLMGAPPFALAVIRKTVPTDSLEHLHYGLFAMKSYTLSTRESEVYRVAFEYVVDEQSEDNYELFAVVPIQVARNVNFYFFN